jgi:hypothetical protein
MIVSVSPRGWNGISKRKTMSDTPSVEYSWMTARQFFISFKEKMKLDTWAFSANFKRTENDQKLIFRHFPVSRLFWSFFFTVRGDNNAEPAENSYFCLIFYALSNAKTAYFYSSCR